MSLLRFRGEFPENRFASIRRHDVVTTASQRDRRVDCLLLPLDLIAQA